MQEKSGFKSHNSSILQKKYAFGSVLLLTLIVLSVLSIISFRVSISAQLQWRMSQNLEHQQQTDIHLDKVVVQLQNGLQHQIKHWPNETWSSIVSSKDTDVLKVDVLQSSALWQENSVIFTLMARKQVADLILSESLLRVRFERQLDTGKVLLTRWTYLL